MTAHDGSMLLVYHLDKDYELYIRFVTTLGFTLPDCLPALLGASPAQGLKDIDNNSHPGRRSSRMEMQYWKFRLCIH